MDYYLTRGIPAPNGMGRDDPSYRRSLNGDGSPIPLPYDADRFSPDGSDLYIAPHEVQLDYIDKRIAELHAKEASGGLTRIDIDMAMLLQAKRIVADEHAALEAYTQADPLFTQHITDWVAQEVADTMQERPFEDSRSIQINVIDALATELIEEYSGTIDPEDETDIEHLLQILQAQKLELLALLRKDEIERLYALAA